MALPVHALERLAPYMREAKILSLGYPDLLARAKDIKRLFGYEPTKFNEAAKEWHGLQEAAPDTLELMEAIGSQMTVVDFTDDRGCEVIADLNEPHVLGKFDLVLDPGTLEHCFNIGQAFLNAANAVKVGGRIFHTSPMSMLNHGFYNLCPTLFHDFYKQNGWELAELLVVPFREPECRATGRFDTHTEHMLRVMAHRRTDAPLVMPIQTKYLQKLEARKAA
jgi:hypothetical protein